MKIVEYMSHGNVKERTGIDLYKLGSARGMGEKAQPKENMCEDDKTKFTSLFHLY